ncbi:MAG: hypothetical protein OXI79_01075, partial [Gammaproteobacteria bacterium]|nr:hypothetical protein [Gammaproteobacteria bacterium]
AERSHDVTHEDVSEMAARQSVFTQVDCALITQSDGPRVAKLAFERTRQSLPANRPRKSVIAQRETRDGVPLTKQV